ncbi:MAG: hypothetical protein WC091_02770 [Sulfuricellaceae bacterium]
MIAWFLGLGVRFWVGMAVGCALTASVLGGIHKLSNAMLTHKLRNQCVAAQKLTNEVSDGLQKEIAALDARLRDARRLYGNTCATFTPPRYDAAPGRPLSGTVPKGAGNSVSIPVGKIIDLMGEADKEVAKLKACQRFLRGRK